MVKRTAVALVSLFLAVMLRGQTADPQLLAEINKIKAIDNHSHPPKVVAAGEKDDDYDALPCDPLEQAPMPVKVRADNPEFIEAWKALWGYQYNDVSPEHVRDLVARKQQIRQQQGDGY